MSDEIMTLPQMCEAFEVTARTLRHYEYIELLAPKRDGRTRLYGARERARLKLILRGRRFGFTLEEIRQWLEMYDRDSKNVEQMSLWVAAATQQITHLEGQRDQLAETITELTHLRDLVRSELEA